MGFPLKWRFQERQSVGRTDRENHFESIDSGWIQLTSNSISLEISRIKLLYENENEGRQVLERASIGESSTIGQCHVLMNGNLVS